VLRNGALPAPLKLMEERTVGPSLGQDSIRNGILSFVVGSASVILFMMLYYRGGGLIADGALLLNVLLLVATFAAFGFTLSLPGIAGIVLTIGMAGRRERPHPRAHPRGAPPREDAARGDRGGLRPGLVRDPRLEPHDVPLGSHPVPVRDGTGPWIRDHALRRHPHEPRDRRLRNPRRLRLADHAPPAHHGEPVKGEPQTMATRPSQGTAAKEPVAHRFFELIPSGTQIDFVGLRFKMLVLSWASS
jgi:hypothetical protein